MEGLTEGRIVHYVLPDGPYAGEHRPAIVVKVWRDGNGKPPENGCCQLCVFMDGTNDQPERPWQDPGMTRWATSVTYSEEPKPYSWHWIEKA